MSNLADGLYKVISNEASNQLSQYQADKTISGEIFSIVDAAKGEYKVRYQDGIWSAFSQGKTKYKIGDNVLVKIPLGDFSKTKYIEGYTYNTDIAASNESSQIEESFSPDWSAIYGQNWSGEMGLIAYDGVNHKSEITLFAANDVTSHSVFQQYANRGTEFRISAEFMTTFVDAKTTGNYGLRLTFATSKEDSPEVTYTLDTSLFNGDPYRNSYWAPQTILLTVPKRYLTGLRKVVFFQEGFTDYDPVNNSTQPNIYCRNFKAEWINVTDLTDSSYYLTVATPQGMVFTDNYPSLTLQAKLMSGSESLMSKSSCSCLWYAEDPGILIGSEQYEKAGGIGWRRIQKDKFDIITISRSECPAATTNFKVVVIYNEDKILSKEISLINLTSQYDLYLDLTSDTILEIKDKKNDTLTVSGLWYIELPDTTRIAAGDTKSSSIDLTPYLAYPWIKVYCNLFDGSTKIGVLNWTNYRSNDEDELPNFILQYSGDDVFHYDANGDIYDVTEYDDIEHVLRCNIATSQADSLTFTMRWLDSDKKPITTEQDFKDSMMRSVWVDAGDNSLHFKVRTKFYEMLNNNTVYVRLTALDGTYVDYEKEISFLKDGDQGTNGTTYLCLIRPINLNSEVKRTDKVALRYANGAWGTDQIAFKAFVYCNGELIEQRTDKADFNVSYTWQSRNVEIVTAGQGIYHKVNIKPMENGGTDKYFNGGQHTRPGDTALTPEEMGGFYIKVQVDIRYKTESKTSIYAYYPIDVCIGAIDLAKVSYAAPQYIKYSSSGVNPQYDSEPLAFSYDGVDGKVESLSGFLGIWNNYLTPASHYTGENNSVGLLKMSMENNEVDYLLHSVFMYLNPYGNEAINSWDGTTVEINDDGGTILAPQIGAGTKNTSNQFSGVVMGKDSTQDKTGLYGYKDGINTFALTEDGKATFGGKQQITIDGDNAQITGKNSVTNNQRFLEINLADPNIKDENGNDTGKAADAIKIGSSISDPNFLVDYDGNLKCTNANISGTINATAGKIGDCNIEDGTLKIAQANISEKLTASVIDGSNLNVNSANIANSVNTNWVYAGNITANQISGGTINADVVVAGQVYAGNISNILGYDDNGKPIYGDDKIEWSYLGGPASKLSLNSTNDLAVNGTLYTGKIISNDQISGASASFTNSVNADKIIFTSEGSTTELYQDGLTYNGKAYSWANIAGGTVKAVFGA